MDTQAQIRRATAADAAPLARLAEATFRATFASFNSEADMRRHCESHYGTARQLVEIENPRIDTWLAAVAGSLLGYAQVRHERAPPSVGGTRQAEIHRFYIDAAAHGRGLAHQLMRHVLAQLEAAGADVVWLGVWEQNARAQAFYRKWGFTIVGEHIFRLGADPQRDLLMSRAFVP